MIKSSIKYRPEIDGIRTIAVVPVILFHLGSHFFSGGYYGVDVFFVISGYLITSLITKSITRNDFSMFQFWLRRVKRLLPLLVLVVLTTLLVNAFLVFKPDVKNAANDAIPAIFSYSNFYALFNFRDYWGSAAESSYFLHTWSLSVEEQFYLIFPFFLLLAHKLTGKFLKPLIILTIFSFILFLVFVYTKKNVAFFVLPTRVWELSIGGILSVWSFDLGEKKKLKWLPFLGIVMIFSSFIFAKEKIGLEVLLAVFGTVFVIHSTSQSDLIGRFLSSKILVFFGKLSYSMYLWHWPIIVLRKDISFQLQEFSEIFLDISCFGLTILLSIISYYLVESKTRNHNKTPKFVIAGYSVIIILVIYFNSTFYNIKYDSDFKVTSFVVKYDISPIIPERRERYYGINILERTKEHENTYKSGIVKTFYSDNPQVILIGDSHGVMWTGLFDEVCSDLRIGYSFYTMNGLSPFFNFSDVTSISYSENFPHRQRIEYALELKKNIIKWKPKIIFISLKWDGALNDAIKHKEFSQFIDFATSENCKVVIISQPPTIQYIGDHNTNQYLSYLGIKNKSEKLFLPYTKTKVTSETSNKLIKIARNNVEILWTDAELTVKDSVWIGRDNELFYYDDDHLSYEGTKVFYDKMHNFLKSSLK